MNVWVLESGCYDSRGVVGVFSTAEKAMEAYPAGGGRLGGWQESDGSWLDWDEGMELTSYQLDPVQGCEE